MYLAQFNPADLLTSSVTVSLSVFNFGSFESTSMVWPTLGSTTAEEQNTRFERK